MLTLLMALCVAASAMAEDAEEASLELLVATLQADQKALVEVNLKLDDAETKSFWPVYDRYHGELDSVSDRLAKLIEDYTANFGTMSDEEALQIVEDFVELERERAEVREKYVEPFSEVLPGRKLVRFYQIENKVQALLRYELAREIPVIDPQ